MYYNSPKEGKILTKFIAQRYKPLLSKLRRDCKHQIMINHGVCFVIVAMLKSHTINTDVPDANPLNLNMDFEIKLMREDEMPTVTDDGLIYTMPIMLYNPGSYQAKIWADSTQARKAIIKEVLKDLKEEKKKVKS